MATYDVGTGTAGTLRLIVNLVSQDSVADTTTVSWELHLICGNHTSFQLTAKAWSASILGVGYSGSFTFDFRSTTDVLIASGTTTVSANPDGTPANISVSGSIASTGTTGLGGPTTTSGTFTPPTIPRATQPTVSPTSGNTGSTYTIGVVAASSAFYHDFYYSLDGGSTYTSIASNIAATTTSQNWTPAHTLLPNATSVTVLLRVDTRSSSGGTIIGTKTVSLPLTVPTSVKPTVSAVSFVDAQTSSPDLPTLMGGAGRFVQRWSKLKPTVTSAGSGGSTVTSSAVTQNGQVAASGVSFGLPIALSGAVPYSAIATDSRSRDSDPFTGTVAVTAYNFPNLPTPDVHRTSDAAGLIPATAGTYITIIPAASVSDMTFASAQKNLLEWQVRIKPTGGSYTTVQAWTATGVSGNTWTTKAVYAGYSSATEYVVEISIRDVFGKNGYDTADTVKVLTVVVPSESVAFDFDQGLGLGINKYRQNGALDVHGDSYIDGVMHQGAGANAVIDVTNLATSSAAGIIKKAVDTDLTSTDAAVTPHGLLSQLVLAAQAKLSCILNGANRTNQDGYVSGTSIPIGTYAYDGWKASGATNLLTNPSAEGTLPAILNQGITLTKDSAWAQFRTNSFKMVATGASGDSFMSLGENVAVATFGLVPGKTYTISGYCKVVTVTSGTATTPVRVRGITMFFNSVGEINSTQAVNTAGTITRVSMTFTVPVGTTTTHLRIYHGTTAGTVQWDGLMLTEGSTLYSYFDGATTDCSWSGTADASTSYNVPNVVPTLTGTFDANYGSLFTINTNGRISQIVERSRVPAGTYIIAHGGTATLRVYNNTLAPGSRPAFAAGPITFVADGSDDVVVELSGGGAGATFGQARMFAGSTDFGFALPSLGDELRDCQRYYVRFNNGTTGNSYLGSGWQLTTTRAIGVLVLPTPMRAQPFASQSGLQYTDGTSFNFAVSSFGSVSGTSVTSLQQFAFDVAFSSAGAANRPGSLFFVSATPAWLALDARLR